MDKPAAYSVFSAFLGDPESSRRGMWETEELLNAAEAVRELKRQPGWAVVQQLLAAHEKQLMDALLFNPASDHVEEARKRGIVAGVKAATQAADSILWAAERRERDEAEQVAEAAGETRHG